MAWLAWRQHRLESTAAAGLLALLGVLLVVTGLRALHAYDALGIADCVDARPRTCAFALDEFARRFSWLQSLRPWLNFVPPVVAVLLAAPFVLELEQGTYRLAWTQGVGRGRWLAVRLGYLVATALVAGLALTLLFTFWRRPFDPIYGRIEPSVFDFEGVVPLAYVLFGVSLVVALGALTRRSAIAIAGGFVGFVVTRLVVMTWVRPHYLPPVRLTTPVGTRGAGSLDRAWTLSGSIVDRAGRPIQPGAMMNVCPPGSARGDLAACFRSHGAFDAVVYQPASRFWAFQAIEAGLYVAASAALLALAVWWIRRRLA